MAESSAPTDDERMRAAIELATGQPSPSARAMAAAARPFTPRGTWVAVGIATAVVLVLGRPGSRGSAGVPPVPGWREALSWGFIAAAVLGVVVLVVAFLRSGVIGRWRSSPLRVLTEHQRAQLRLQVDGEEAVVVGELPLTRMMAADGLRTVPAVWWWLPATSVFVAGALRPRNPRRDCSRRRTQPWRRRPWSGPARVPSICEPSSTCITPPRPRRPPRDRHRPENPTAAAHPGR